MVSQINISGHERHVVSRNSTIHSDSIVNSPVLQLLLNVHTDLKVPLTRRFDRDSSTCGRQAAGKLVTSSRGHGRNVGIYRE